MLKLRQQLVVQQEAKAKMASVTKRVNKLLIRKVIKLK